MNNNYRSAATRQRIFKKKGGSMMDFLSNLQTLFAFLKLIYIIIRLIVRAVDRMNKWETAK